MSYPENYRRAFDFSAYQNSNPTRPLPGVHVNIELDAIAGIVRSWSALIEGVVRSDGALANGSVGIDQINPAVVLGFTPPTAWAPNTAYTATSTVFENNVFYRANSAHTSGATFNGSLWTQLADFALLGAFNGTLGATTPNTVAATTGSFSGTVTIGDRLHVGGPSGVAPNSQLVFNNNGTNFAKFYDPNFTGSSGGTAIGGAATVSGVPASPTMFWNVNTNTVGINTDTPTTTAKLEAQGNVPLASPTDGGQWAHGSFLFGATLDGVGDGTSGSANDAGVVIETYTPPIATTVNYQKNALSIVMRNDDPGNGHVGDNVGLYINPYIAGNNPTGRIWAENWTLQILPGSDGIATGLEALLQNNGSDVTGWNSTNSKVMFNVGSSGAYPGSILLYANGPWHDVIYAVHSDIQPPSGDNYFLRLDSVLNSGTAGLFSVDDSGYVVENRTTIGAGSPITSSGPGGALTASAFTAGGVTCNAGDLNPATFTCVNGIVTHV